MFPSRTLPPGTPVDYNPSYPTQELWGPIPKEYGSFLGAQTWKVPGYIDIPDKKGVMRHIPVLTKCSNIGEYMRKQLGADLTFFRKNPATCWEDDSTILAGLRKGLNPPNYYVSVGDRRFQEGFLVGMTEPAVLPRGPQRNILNNLLATKGGKKKVSRRTRKRRN